MDVYIIGFLLIFNLILLSMFKMIPKVVTKYVRCVCVIIFALLTMRYLFTGKLLKVEHNQAASVVPQQRPSGPDATNNFIVSGKARGANQPTDHSWTRAMQSIKSQIAELNDKKKPIAKRNIIIFHVGHPHPFDSLDVSINNIKIFTSAILKHSDASDQYAFYLFNVIGGDTNPFRRFLPTTQSNVAIADWDSATSDLDTHITTAVRLGNEITKEFNALFCFNQGVRGPILHRNNGQWLTEFHKLLDVHNIGMIGATMSCEISPHIQTPAFGIRTTLIPLISDHLNHNLKATNWLELIAQLEVGLTSVVQKAGYNVTSLLYHSKKHQDYFNGDCIPITYLHNPTSWCDITAKDTFFMKWGGEPLRTNGYMCEDTIKYMRNTLLELHKAEPEVNLIVPETLKGGLLYTLFKEYSNEMYSKTTEYNDVTLLSTINHDIPQSQVCFLIRTAIIHDPDMREESVYVNAGIDGLIQSLIRQSNPNWKAYFFITDPRPFDDKLQQIVDNYKDNRLIYLPVDLKYRPVFTTVDGGYTTTDYVLRHMSTKQECQYMSVTNADNAYGSDIVNRILNIQRYTPVNTPLPDMILNPMDTRNIADQDYIFRHEESLWNKHCVGIRSMLKMSRLAFTSQPVPIPGSVDLAAMFFRHSKFYQDNVYFSNFTNPAKYPCLGCQDGYLTEFLVLNRLWTYHKLPIDGLKSIVFHGPSPTLCIASGNVWFDHPLCGKVGCLSHKTVTSLQIHDNHKNPIYDWDFFQSNDDRACLRFTSYGFNQSLLPNSNL